MASTVKKKKTKKKGTGNIAQLQQKFPGIYTNMSASEIKKLTGKSPADLIKIQSSGMGTRKNISDRH
mgnify:CR=1 FL=1